MDSRRRLIAAVAVAGGLLLPATALAAGGNRLSISAPSTAHLHKKFNYTVRGHSAHGSRGLATFANTGVGCPRTLRGELKTSFAGNGVYYRVPHAGSFHAGYLVTPNSLGSHFICAYLYVTSSGHTLARAWHKYVTST